MAFEKLEEKLSLLGFGQRRLVDAFFDAGNVACDAFQRKSIVDIDSEHFLHNELSLFDCQSSGCNRQFSQLIDYEHHYTSSHRNACNECRRSFPNEHLLTLHLQESHDAFFQRISTTKSMYSCLLSQCGVKCPSTDQRRKHCIEQHRFPSNFRFAFHDNSGSKRQQQTANDITMEAAAAVGGGDGGGRSANGEKHDGSSTVDSGGGVAQQNNDDQPSVVVVINSTGADDQMETDLSTSEKQADSQFASHSMAASRCEYPNSSFAKQSNIRIQFKPKLPKNICFGQGMQRGFKRANQNWYQKQNPGSVSEPVVSIEHTNLSDLEKSLPS